MFGNARAIVAEAIGTFALVFVGAGAIMADALTGAPGHFGIALSFGLVVAGVVYVFGAVSGAHINPAVTLAFAFGGSFPARRVPEYLVAQGVGALSAAALLRTLLGPTGGIGATSTGLSLGSALVVEILLTAFLMTVILAVVASTRGPVVSGIAIGGAVFAGALWGGPLTGASMNPARSLGPAVVAGDVSQLWIYLVGPILGAVLAVALFALVRGGVEIPLARWAAARLGALRPGVPAPVEAQVERPARAYPSSSDGGPLFARSVAGSPRDIRA